MKTLLLMVSFLFSFFSFAQIKEGERLPPIELSGDAGGHLDGSPWQLSDSLKEKKITVIYYVDPDEKDANEEISEAFQKRNYSSEKVQFIAIINMAATWLPNFAISASLKKKQEKYPDTLYLRDYDKVGVKKWGIADDQNDIIILNPQGEVLFFNYGTVQPKRREEILQTLDKMVK